MTENPARQAPAEPIAIVGMACRFPDASGPAEFLELVLTGRQAFLRLPPARLDVSEYGNGEPGFPGPSGLAPGAFGAVPGPVDAPLVLGSPGLNETTLHVLQACLPHRRLLATGCESVTFSGREVRGALRVQAVRRPLAPGDAAGSWDVVAADATGQAVVTWQGVRLRDVGALAPPGAWHPALLAISMEARAAESGLDPGLRAVISCGVPPRDPGASLPATSMPAGTARAGQTGRRAPGRLRVSS